MWSSDGVGALAVSSSDFIPDQFDNYPATWAATASEILFSFANSTQGDLYLFPSRTLLSGTTAYYRLIGTPPVPPRYSLGFLASRWGWRNRAYIDNVLNDFRDGGYPLDAFICDFEWYTPEPDYKLPPKGSPSFQDFTYNNITFPAPVQQLQQYHTDLHVRFGGIRKPRLGNRYVMIDRLI